MPFVGGQIGGDLQLVETGEADDGGDGAAGLSAVRCTDGNAGENAVAAAGEQAQIFFGSRDGIGFGQDASAGGNHGVGGDDIGVALNGEASFSQARRSAWARGGSGGAWVSSISGAMISSGSMPICRRSSSRLGLAEPSII